MGNEPRMFPIQSSDKNTKPHPTRIPWAIADLAYSVYSARYGRSQSLEHLAERGGFGANEMDLFLPDWRERCDENSSLRTELQQENERLKAELHKVIEELRVRPVKLLPTYDLEDQNATLRTELQQAREELERFKRGYELRGETIAGYEVMYPKLVEDLQQQLAQSQEEADKWKITAEAHCVVIMDHEHERDALQLRLDEALLGLQMICNLWPDDKTRSPLQVRELVIDVVLKLKDRLDEAVAVFGNIKDNLTLSTPEKLTQGQLIFKMQCVEALAAAFLAAQRKEATNAD
jgi:hypothetical protein